MYRIIKPGERGYKKWLKFWHKLEDIELSGDYNAMYKIELLTYHKGIPQPTLLSNGYILTSYY